MSCFQSPEERLQHRVNKEIDRQLQREKRELKSEIKLLLLGTSAIGQFLKLFYLNLIRYGRIWKEHFHQTNAYHSWKRLQRI